MIDCATARPEESAQRVDWEGKVALIQCAQARFTATAKLGEAAACACNELSLIVWPVPQAPK